MYCKKCGNQIKEGLKFCVNCGTEVVIEKKEEEPLVCEKCNTPIEKGMKFCGSCGNAVATKVLYCHKCNAQIQNGIKYCGVCGATVQDTTTICTSCGREMKEDELFCINCGALKVKSFGAAPSAGVYSPATQTTYADNGTFGSSIKRMFTAPTEADFKLHQIIIAGLFAVIFILLFVPAILIEIHSLSFFSDKWSEMYLSIATPYSDTTLQSILKSGMSKSEFEAMQTFSTILAIVFDVLPVIAAIVFSLVSAIKFKEQIRRRFIIQKIVAIRGLCGIFITMITISSMFSEYSDDAYVSLTFGGVLYILFYVVLIAYMFYVSYLSKKAYLQYSYENQNNYNSANNYTQNGFNPY